MNPLQRLLVKVGLKDRLDYMTVVEMSAVDPNSWTVSEYERVVKLQANIALLMAQRVPAGVTSPVNEGAAPQKGTGQYL